MTKVRARLLSYPVLLGALSLAVTALVPGAPPPVGELIGAGPAPDLILISTGDVIGHLEPCG